MNNKQKNIVTNLLGLVFYVLSVYAFFLNKEIKYIISLLLIGSVLFLFKNSFLVGVLKNIVNNKSNTLRSTVDPDKEFPDEKG